MGNSASERPIVQSFAPAAIVHESRSAVTLEVKATPPPRKASHQNAFTPKDSSSSEWNLRSIASASFLEKTPPPVREGLPANDPFVNSR